MIYIIDYQILFNFLEAIEKSLTARKVKISVYDDTKIDTLLVINHEAMQRLVYSEKEIKIEIVIYNYCCAANRNKALNCLTEMFPETVHIEIKTQNIRVLLNEPQQFFSCTSVSGRDFSSSNVMITHSDIKELVECRFFKLNIRLVYGNIDKQSRVPSDDAFNLIISCRTKELIICSAEILGDEEINGAILMNRNKMQYLRYVAANADAKQYYLKWCKVEILKEII